ncbi:hypothetical protein H2199_007436 [Coniosporium tulheliwenetii]|uniref:Uncharacterized protein n=1 Tax=Coniosporium tulheliwenetii TaxID=3383036 RepID=A0ACC2YP91_9PEZI|nr:hypothetical protein H2199_007436 [Cladosporium sp. JES 115]
MADHRPVSSEQTAGVIDLGSEPESDAERASHASEASIGAQASTGDSDGSSLDGSSGDLKTDILECLDAVQSVGSFATFHSLDTIVDPEICVNIPAGAIRIPLPLSEEHAKTIIAVSHQAPFGKGTETIVDTSVRKTWELNYDQFELRNPEWQQYMAQIAKRVADELGILRGTGTFQAQLYKMLLYEKGAMFKAHTDTEKAPGMFGTLVVCLPSKHEGGAIIARHKKQTKVFRTEDFKQSYAAWYSDVKHEITEVTSGYRWVLTYNLVYSGHVYEPLSAANNSRALRLLTAVFKDWRKNIISGEKDMITGDPPPNELIYLLDHQYTEESLNFSALKGKDLVKAQLLKDVCDQTDCCLYLASLERKVFGGVEDGYEDDYYGCGFGYYDDEESEDEDESEDRSENRPTRGYSGDFHEIIDECDMSLKLKRIVDFDGNVVGTEFDADEDNIVQEHPFKDREPDEEDFEGYTGNEGASATHWYRDTALVIVPSEYSISFRLRPFHNGPKFEGRLEDSSLQLGGLIDRLEEELGRDPRNKRLQDELLGTCEFLISHNISLDEVNKRIDRKQHVDGRWDLEKKNASPIAPLEGLSKQAVYFGGLKIEGSASAEQTQRITDLDFLKWAVERLEEVLANPKQVHKQDGVALADLMRWEYSDASLFESMIAMAKKHASNTPFVVSLLATMPRADDAHKQAWKEILSEMLQTFSLCHEPEPEPEPESNFTRQNGPWGSMYAGRFGSMAAYPSMYGAPAPPKPRKAPLDPKAMAELLRDCLSENFDMEAKTILEKVISEADRIDTSDFHTMLLPFLKEVITVMQAQEIPPTDSRFQSLYQSVINSYIKRYVGMEPAPPPNWTRSPVGCGCADCNRLDQFLLDSQRGDYTYETERIGSPHTLVVKKTNKSYKDALHKWQARREEARSDIMALGDENLRTLLRDRYEELTQFTAVSLPEAARAVPSTRTLPPLPSANRAHHTKPAKRQRLNHGYRPGPPRPGQPYSQPRGRAAQGPSSAYRPSGAAAAQPLAPNSGNQRPPMADASRHTGLQPGSMKPSNEPVRKRKATPELVDLTGGD